MDENNENNLDSVNSQASTPAAETPNTSFNQGTPFAPQTTPVTPAVPVTTPVTPVTPATPAAPTVEAAAPATPAAPVSPVTPVAPVTAPVAPVAPATPVEAAAPVVPATSQFAPPSAASVEPAIPTVSSIPSPIPTTAAPQPVVNRAIPDTKAKKPEKGVNLLLIFAIVAVVAVVGCVVFAGFGKVIANSFNKLTMSPQKYCQTVLTKYTKARAKEIAKNYGDVSKQADAKESAYEATASVKFSEDALDLLSDYGVDDLDFLADSKATIRVDHKENLYAVKASYGTEKKSVLSLNAVVDLDEEMVFLQVPEFNEQYLCADISDYMKDLTSDEYQELIENLDSIEKLSEKEIEDFINRYCEIVIKHFEEVEEETVELKVDKVSTKVTALTVILDAETTQEIAVDLLEALMEDETLEKYCDSYVEALDLDDDLWDEFVDELDYMNEEISDWDADDEEGAIILQFYVDNKGEICGLCGEFASDDDYEDIDGGFAYYEFTKGSNYAFKMTAYEYDEDLFTVSGTGSKSLIGGKISGEFKIEIEDRELVFTLKDCKFGLTELSGTVSVKVADVIEFLDTDELDDYEDYEIAISFKYTTKTVMYKMAIIDGKEEFISVQLDVNNTSFKKISVPNEKDCADLMDEDDLEDWVSEVEVDDVNEALEDMGFPEDFIPEPDL